MKKALVIILIVAICLLVVGGAVFAIGMQRIGWDFTALSGKEYYTDTVTFHADEVSEIAVELNTEDVTVLTSENDEISVEYFIVKNKKDEVIRRAIPSLAEGVLHVGAEGEKTSFMNFFGTGKTPKVVVKIPAEKVLPLSVKVTTGDIVIGEEGKERTYSSVKINTSTGNVTLLGRTLTETLTIGVSTGNVKVKGEVACNGDAEISASTGNIKIAATLSAAKITLKTSTGDVESSAPLTSDNISVHTSTGEVELTLSGRKEDYTYTYETSTGDSNYPNFSLGERKLDVHTSTGDIELTVRE